jgi:hypothetical protein
MIYVLWLFFAAWWAQCSEWLATRLLRFSMSSEEFDRWSRIKRQVEYYFGEDNYPRDKYLLQVAADNGGCAFYGVSLFAVSSVRSSRFLNPPSDHPNNLELT